MEYVKQYNDGVNIDLRYHILISYFSIKTQQKQNLLEGWKLSSELCFLTNYYKINVKHTKLYLILAIWIS